MKLRNIPVIAGMAGLSWLPLSLLGAGSAANTEIRNQSIATYIDSSGDPQITTSNEVINIVQAVYGFTITPNAPSGEAPNSDAAFAGGAALEQSTSPGNIAYFSYVLQNNGNAQDSYDFEVFFNTAENIDAISPDEINIYLDSNGNGRVDPGDILLVTNDGSTASTGIAPEPGTLVATTPQIPADGYANLLVAVHTPIASTAADAIYLDIDAESKGNSSKDAISNMAKVTFTLTDGVLTVTKDADVNAAVAGQTITYTVSGSNAGAAPVYSVSMGAGGQPDVDSNGDDTADIIEGALITDDLDETLLDVGDDYANVNFSSIAPANAVFLYWDDTNDIYTSVKPEFDAAAEDARVALFIPDADSVDNVGNGASNTVLNVGQTYSYTFTVNVINDNEVVDGQVIINDATAIYKPSAVGATIEKESNDVIITIARDVSTLDPDVLIGPFGFPAGDADDDDIVTADYARVDSYGLIADGDITYAGSSAAVAGNAADAKAATRYAGEVVTIPLTVQNTGNSPDTFNITRALTNGSGTGYTVQLFKSDGITPLADTNGDAYPDVGILAINATATVVARITIADNAEQEDPSTWTITATSSISGTVTDPTEITVAAVSPAGVDIAAQGQLAGDDNPAAVSNTAANDDDDDTTGASVAPGASVIFQVDVGNMRPINQSDALEDIITKKADTYNLTWVGKNDAGVDSATANGFIVNFYRDTGDNGELATSELLPISDTSEIQPIADVDLPYATANQRFDLAVRVTVPDGTVAGDYYIHTTATSTNNSAKSDTMVLKVTVPQIGAIDILPDNTATVVPGGSVTFNHLVVNNGNVTEPANLALPTTLPPGWTAVFVSCADGSVIGNTAVTAAIAPGASVEVCLRVFTPTSAPVGSTTPFEVTATGAVTGSSASAVDVVNVISGNLLLTKSRTPSGLVTPGATITYTTVYKNLGSGDVTEVLIFDAIPAHTVIDISDLSAITGVLPDGTEVDADNDPDYFEVSTNGGTGYVKIDDYAAGTITHIRFDLNGGAAIGVGATVQPGEEGELVFPVTVD